MGDNIICPVCGINCLGKGGVDCIDKPAMVFGDDDRADKIIEKYKEARYDKLTQAELFDINIVEFRRLLFENTEVYMLQWKIERLQEILERPIEYDTKSQMLIKQRMDAIDHFRRNYDEVLGK